MDIIITSATVATMFFNVASSTTGDYAYNADIENGRVETMYVMKHTGNILSNKLRYMYTYDEQERLVRKEAMLWNSGKNSWEPDYRLDFAYVDNGYSVERSDWNAKRGNYDEAKERMEYDMLMDNVIAVNTFGRNDATEAFELKTNMLVMAPQYNLLAEYAKENN